MKISRREFIKIGSLGFSAVIIGKITPASGYLPELPKADLLGRVFNKVDVKVKPDPQSATAAVKFDDAVLPILREVIGEPVTYYWKNRTWYETPEGYIPAISVQKTRNIPNIPLESMPLYGDEPGMWAEVTVPYVDISLIGDTPKSPRLKETQNPRFYYSQVLWIKDVKTGSDGESYYHVAEKHGTYFDEFWADARAFKPLTPEEISPIRPETGNKHVVVDLNHQTLACFENDREILFSRISSGAKFDNEGNPVEKWSTPVGENHVINRKYISLHMAGGTSKASGYEEFAVSWTSIFATDGVAIHSTYWHNNYGEMLSHGCVNAEPDVAKFIYRWSQPATPYESGMIEVQGYSGTTVKVREG